MACPKCGDPNPRSTVLYLNLDGGPTKPSVCDRCAAKEKYEEAAKLKVLRREMIPLKVGMTTLVGTIPWPEDVERKKNTGSAFPMSHGNCCSLTWPINKIKQPDGTMDYQPTGPSYACRNMHSENVDEAAERWPELLNGVEIEVLEDNTCRVVDERLPADWKKHYCSGCGYFENEEAYQRHIAPSEPRDEQPRKLKTTWSAGEPLDASYQEGETGLDPGYVYSPYINPDFFGKITIKNLSDVSEDPRVCDGCGHFNEEVNGKDYSGGPVGRRYITCPKCKKKIILEEW